MQHIGVSRQRVLAACKLLSNQARFNILTALVAARKKDKELCVNEIASTIDMSQSATSHQLALLEAHGAVVAHRMGKTTCYDLADSPLSRDIEKIIDVFI